MPISEKRSALGRHGAAVRWGSKNSDDTARDLAAARIAEYVSAVVASAPPLTPEQRDRISSLLRPAALAGGAHE